MRRFIYPLLLIFSGIILFGTNLFYGFAYDDITQIANNRFVHQFQNLFFFFTSGIQAPTNHANFFTLFYRPLPFGIYVFLYQIDHGNALIFHIFQLTIFLSTVILLYVFFRGFFAAKLSFVLALTFLLHPINQTLAAYITDTEATLCMFFGILALVVARSHYNFLVKNFFSSLFLLLSIFSKEFGFLFFPFLIIFTKFFSKSRLLILILLITCSIFFYSIFREIASNQPYLTYLIGYSPSGSIINRLFLIPVLIFYFMREIFIPGNTIVKSQTILLHHPPTILLTFFLLIISIAVLFYGFILKQNKPKLLAPFSFFILWFVVGFLPYIQIIPLDLLIARRWFSFSLIGLLGILGVVWTAHSEYFKRFSFVVKFLYCLYILFLFFATIYANWLFKDWAMHIATP